ncbi:putative flocculation protein FLO11-like [Scophthalmus maximus]|uniref:Putative flocculation protein FLO11-like n=1 Tax=Scophthalmus maximus TaxID=52904 RepID=A0A2U9BMI4_SCOMX|nr:putative flocculation protein FLO11-like [Scophthalmus maximus]
MSKHPTPPNNSNATSASSPRRCGGDVSLGREPAGRVSLTLPGPVAGPGQPHSADRPSDGSLPLCTWMMEVPPGRTLLLKVERGSSLSVRCARREGDPDRALESGRTALLSGCDGNKAALTWTGAGRSSNALRLSYYVQEDERNSSEDHTGPQSQTGTSSTSTAPLSHKSVRGTQGGVRGRLHEGPERSRRLRSELGPSSGDKGLPHPTSPLQGLGVAGRGTLPLPEEGPHNGADTSGPARRTDGRVSATHPYFQHTNSDGPPPTLMPLTAATARGSRALLGTGTRARATQRAGRHVSAHTIRPSPAVAEVEDRTSSSARSSSAPSAALTSADENSRSTAETHSLLPTRSPTGSAAPPSPSSTSPRRSAAPHTPHRARSSPTPAITAAKSDDGHREVDEDESWQHTPTATPPRQPPWTTPHPSRESRVAPTPSAPTAAPARSSTASQTPRFYIVPDQPATVKVESIELLLQIIVEESGSALGAGLEEDTAAWMEPYLQKAPGFGRLQGVWSSGHAVQSLVEFKTSGALQWLSAAGPSSLLEMTGLAQAVRQGKTFRSSKISNITLGGLQGDVCDWLLQCPAGYKCVSQSGAANYNCSSVCRFDYCHHHGICTHHPGQLPVCRCLVGEDFWYMGQRCDVRMTRARLVGACLAVLLVMVTVVAALAFVAVRRYRAILIQAKVDQTRSSYRRFNHFDELSGRFWLRSWAGSADSMDNPAFTRSDELLHLRALDRPCCYHDDTLSLASTSPSHGTHINTIYPHSSQYGWRGSGMSVGDGVLDSGKASDLSVCSWPVEPIHWTPFPLLQQLASNRTPTVRVSRPRSYCEGMELVDLGKSWTA